MAAAADTEARAGAGSSQRLDQWLFFSRLVKSRTLAATLITEGKFRLNKERIDKPSVAVKPGDIITSTAGRAVRTFRVTGIGKRRGPAAEARELYEDLTPPPPPAAEREPVAAAREAGSGRPTKKDRRDLEKFRGR